MSHILKAEELIKFDVSNFEDNKEKLAGLLKLVAAESEETRARIANELIEIVANRHEREARRSQAAFLLGTSFRSLENSGAVQITNALIKTLELEFMGSLQLSVNSSRNHDVIKADGMQLVFLQGLVFSILVINPILGKSIVNKLYGRIEDAQMRDWLENISKCSGASPG